jgi:hypothetical protein
VQPQVSPGPLVKPPLVGDAGPVPDFGGVAGQVGGLIGGW